MLVDLPADWRERTEHRQWTRLASYTSPQRVYQGVYLAHTNFSNEIRPLVADMWPDVAPLSPHGVVDHWTQLPLRTLRTDIRPLLVYLAAIRKDDQPSEYGWRWHKWGPYLGIHDIEGYEYLYDTPDVVEVYAYHVVELINQGPEMSD